MTTPTFTLNNGVTIPKIGFGVFQAAPEETRAAVRTAAQVMLAWHLAQGRQVIPKSVTPARIEENLAVLDIALDPAELAAIDGLETGVRSGPEPASLTLERAWLDIPEG